VGHEQLSATLANRRRGPSSGQNARHNAFTRRQPCYEQREAVIDAFGDLADTINTVRSLISQAWTTHRWNKRPARRP
jgi:hypothetical protein